MTQLTSRPTSSGKQAATPARQALPGLPRTGLTPEQQLEALARVQNQAEQRVRLGLQLFKAAEAHTTSHRQILDEITAEREKYREELSQDVTRRLHAFDQWIGQMDDTFTQAFLTLEERVDAVEQRITDSQRHLENMVRQTQKMLDQAMALLDGQTIAPVVEVVKTAQPQAAAPEQMSLDAYDDEPLIKPVSPVALPAKLVDETCENAVEESSVKHDVAENAAAINESSDAQAPVVLQSPLVQSVSYADILDRIYESRKQIKQSKQSDD